MGKVEEDPPPGAPDWIVTFADMISLLVTFFILLMTFSSMEAFDAFQVDGDLIGTSGTLTAAGGPDAIKPPQHDFMNAMDAVRGAQSPHSRPTEELLENIEDMGQQANDEHVEVDLKAIKDGLIIRYDERASFKPGSAELSSYLESAVTELARVLEHYPHTVVVEGHTDNRVQATDAYPDPVALSASRASAVVEAMLSSSQLNPLQVQIAAIGDERPRIDNDTPEGRQLNRRVEIRVISLDQARAARLSGTEAENG